jgi:hypothetical protein
MKIIKKKYGDQSRFAIEWEEKTLSLERTIDEYKRK